MWSKIARTSWSSRRTWRSMSIRRYSFIRKMWKRIRWDSLRRKNEQFSHSKYEEYRPREKINWKISYACWLRWESLKRDDAFKKLRYGENLNEATNRRDPILFDHDLCYALCDRSHDGTYVCKCVQFNLSNSTVSSTVSHDDVWSKARKIKLISSKSFWKEPTGPSMFQKRSYAYKIFNIVYDSAQMARRLENNSSIRLTYQDPPQAMLVFSNTSSAKIATADFHLWAA